jgi:hypothetical protein
MVTMKINLIIKANSSLEWIKIIRDAIYSGSIFDKHSFFREEVDQPERDQLDQYYFYVDRKGTAYALPRDKNVSVPEIGYLSGHHNVVLFIKEFPNQTKDIIDRLLKIQAFL